MSFKKTWSILKDVVTTLEIYRILKEILVPSILTTGGGIVLSSVNWIRDLVQTYWYLFYIFTLFSLCIFIFSIRLIIKVHNEIEQKKKQAIDTEKLEIENRIILIPRGALNLNKTKCDTSIWFFIINPFVYFDFAIDKMHIRIDDIFTITKIRGKYKYVYPEQLERMSIIEKQSTYIIECFEEQILRENLDILFKRKFARLNIDMEISGEFGKATIGRTIDSVDIKGD